MLSYPLAIGKMGSAQDSVHWPWLLVLFKTFGCIFHRLLLHHQCISSIAGIEMASKGCTNDIFKKKLYFPRFRDLDFEYEIDERYWKEDSCHPGFMIPACTWYFLGEITNDMTSQCTFLRNRVLVRDRRGQNNITIAFYPESGSFDFKTLKKGHTVRVWCARKHEFMDGSVGLRIEELNTIKVMPCSLNDLFAMSTFCSETSTTNSCWRCGKKSTKSSSDAACALELKKCASCLTAKYCSRECQVKDWRERHRKWCKALPEFMDMKKIDYGKPQESTYRPDPPTILEIM